MSRTSTDPIADMLTRIRNAIAVNKQEVMVPHSTIKESVARILQNSHFIDSVSVEGDKPGFKHLRIVINSAGTNARITEISRVSTPGRRVYTRSADIPVVKRGRGIIVISTPKGLMTGDEARKKSLGGELICKVY